MSSEFDLTSLAITCVFMGTCFGAGFIVVARLLLTLESIFDRMMASRKRRIRTRKRGAR